MTAIFCRKCKCKEVFLPSKLNPSTQLCKRCEDEDKKTEKGANSKSVILWVSLIVVAACIYIALKPNPQTLQKKADEERVRLLQENLENNKHVILAEIEDAVHSHNYDEALSIAEKYSSLNDSDISRSQAYIKEVMTKEKIDSLLKQAKQIPASNYELNLSIYEKLASIAPDSKVYADKIKTYKDKIQKRKEDEQKRALARLKKKTDEVEGITWFSDKSSPTYNNANAFYLYFGMTDSRKLPLRLKLQYYSDSWLFINSYVVVADGRRFEKSNVSFERDNYTSIWEWKDAPLSESDKEMIDAVIKSKKATIRYYGRQYYNDRTITQAQKNALKNVLIAYDAL